MNKKDKILLLLDPSCKKCSYCERYFKFKETEQHLQRMKFNFFPTKSLSSICINCQTGLSFIHISFLPSSVDEIQKLYAPIYKFEKVDSTYIIHLKKGSR